MPVKGSIKGDINAKKLHARVVYACNQSAEELAGELVVINEKNIEQGKAPNGPQKQNSPGYAASPEKRGKGPLWKTGKLKDAGLWRIRSKSAKREVWIDPPIGSGAAYGITKAKGYKSIATDLPDGQAAYERHAQPVVDRYVEKVKTEE